MEIMTQEEFQGWLTHPGTVQFKQWIAQQVEILKHNWAEKVYQSESNETTALCNAQALGAVQAMQHMINLDYETYVGDMNDE